MPGLLDLMDELSSQAEKMKRARISLDEARRQYVIPARWHLSSTPEGGNDALVLRDEADPCPQRPFCKVGEEGKGAGRSSPVERSSSATA